MGTAVDVGDAQSQLQQARQQANEQAKDIGMGSLDVTREPAGVSPPPKPRTGRQQALPLTDPTPAQAEVQPAQPADADSIPHGNLQPTPPPPPTPQQAAVKPGVWDQTGSEVGNGAVRGFAELGRAAMLMEAAPAIADDALNSFVSGKRTTENQDKFFQAIDKVINPAIDYWKPDDPSKSGLGAQVAGDVAGVIPALLTGPAALPALTEKAVTDAGMQSIQEGQDAKTAAILATVAGVANVAGMKIPLKSPNIWKRIASSIGGNLVINEASQTLAKEILKSDGYQEAADKINLADPRTILSTLVTAIGFGLHRQAGATTKQADQNVQNGTKVGQPPAPDTDLATAPDGTPAPPPPLPTDATATFSKGKTAEGAPVTPVDPTAGPGVQKMRIARPGENLSATAPAPSSVPDQPSIEPAKDLRAQVRDMNDKATPRVGVLVTTDSLKGMAGSKDANALSVNGTLNQARSQNRTVVLPQGELILKTAKIAEVTRQRLASGEDPQAVIGSVTGAGDGKTPDATAVVQGKDAQGAVTTETMVHPDNVDQAVRAVEAQGKTPVVTTPVEAVQRRIDAVSQERNSPTQLGIMTHPDGTDIPVQVEPSETPGMVRVRKLDADGEPETKTIDVDKSRVKIGAPSKEIRPETKVPSAIGAEPELTPKQAETPTKAADTQVTAERAPAVKPSETPADSTAQGQTEEAPAGKTGGERATEDAVVGTEPDTSTKTSEDTSPSAPSSQPLGFTPGESGKGAEAAARRALKAPKIQTGLEALPAALEEHEKQETPQPGRKNVPLAERQENASTFAAVLKAAADSARGKVDVSAIERATRAAKAAERLSEKGKEETAKGQGTGHVKVTALVNEMHKAARGLLGTAREGDDVVVKPKEVELQAKREREAARVKKAAGIEEPKPATPRVRKSLKKETGEVIGDLKKTAPKSKAEIEREGQRLTERYINAEEEDLPNAHKAVEDYLKEHFADQYTPDQTRDILHLLQERRLEENPDAVNNGPRRMSDTIEDEEQVHETEPKTLRTLGLRNVGKHALEFAANKAAALKNMVFNNKLHTQYQNMTASMLKGGAFRDLLSVRDTGRGLSTHALLDTMISHTVHGTELSGLLSNLRRHVPDLPVHVVSHVIDLRSGQPWERASGLFDRALNSIQVAPAHDMPIATIRSLVHEMVHGATEYEIKTNPNGPLAHELRVALAVLRNRMARKYGAENVVAHLDYFSGERQEAPDNYKRSLYGLANISELLAELHVNHDFVQEIVDSEKYADPKEDAKLGMEAQPKPNGLLYRIYQSIGKFFGMNEPKLLSHIAGLGEGVMGEQRAKTYGREDNVSGLPPYAGLSKTKDQFERSMVQTLHATLGANPLEISRALPSFEEVSREPGPLRGVESEIRASFEDAAEEPTRVARLFKQAMNSGIVDGVRSVKTMLKTVPQIFRDHRRDFGDRNDPENPLNRLQDIDHQKNAIIRDLSQHSRDIVRQWNRLNSEDNKTVGTIIRDWTMNKIDPRKDAASQIEGAQESKYNELASQWTKLQADRPDLAKLVDGVFNANKALARAQRRANIDTALEAFSDTPVTDAQKTLLYAARTPAAFDEVVGPGKLIDMGENNDKLKASLKDFAGQAELNGPYAHLGRHGEYVVSADPEGTKTFRSEQEARAFAKQTNELSPNSKGEYVFRGGQHQVDYKIQYTSFHETRNDALEERDRLSKAGYVVGAVTRKTMSRADTPLSAGARDLSAAVEAKINRNGESPANTALVAALRSAMLHLAASRSAYAGSRLARKNFAGVKPEEMRRSFADHTQSTIWHTAQLRTTFPQAAALAKLRNMSRDSMGADQNTLFRRGQAVEALNKHLQDEVQNYGHKSPTNAFIAKLGFMSFLASPSHAAIWMTQNFTTGIPAAGARWGYGRASSTFLHAMGSVLSPAMRDAVNESFAKGGSTKDANEAMMRVISKHDRWGKWAPQIQSMINDGVLGHGYGNELHEMAQSTGPLSGPVNRAFDFARLLPAMADSFNRVSTALTALELTGGDVRKASDFVDEVHADYSQGAKPLAFKKIGRVPGMNSITMFKTYTQSMIHLFYGNMKAAIDGSGEGGRMEAAKTAAGMVVANALFAGVYGAAAIEPLKLAVYAYHKLFDKEGEVFDLKNAIHNWLVEHLGRTAGDAAAGGLPHLAGFDLSSRMGLTDLFFHDPPDLLTSDKEGWKNFAYAQGGPMLDFLGSRTTEFVGHMNRGEGFQAISSLVPIKAYQDMLKAFELGTTGKTNSIGGRMTKPSMSDAAWQALGLKPSSVADAQEAANTKISYQQQVKATKENILKAWAGATGDERLKAQARISQFNRLHPSEAIKPTEQRSMMKYRQESQGNAPTRDRTLNDMLSYTRK
jgi:hypothetical protein